MTLMRKRNSFQEINNSGIKILIGQNFNRMRVNSEFKLIKLLKEEKIN